MPLRTNIARLVKMSVDGRVAPTLSYPNTIGHDGRIRSVPALGGITLNILVGDSAFGWEADHVEPGVSTLTHPEKRSDRPNLSYNFLACVGNTAVVLTGPAKGAKGIVTGHHGGAEHVMIDFPEKVLKKLSYEDKFQVQAWGQGLSFTDAPDVSVSSLDPGLAQKMGLVIRNGAIKVPVAAIIPAQLMGSGLGSTQVQTGDYDMQTADTKALKRHGLGNLALGDIVAIADHDARFGWSYREGAMVIGVVIHGDSILSGHGPGITTLLCSHTGAIVPVQDKKANIARYLGIGRYRKK